MFKPILNRHLPAVLVFCGFLSALALPGLLRPPNELSLLERRDLAQFPDVTADSIFDGQFSEDYGVFLQDQAAFRDELRFAKSLVERRLLLRPENNGVYVVEGNIYDKFYGIRHELIERAARVIGEIADSIDSDDVYAAVIPSKAQMLDRSRYLLSDQEIIAETLAASAGTTYVDLMGLAVPGNEHLYYITDPHWTTGGAIRAYELLARTMGHEPVEDYSFELATDSYVGSNYGKAASWSIAKDSIYLAHNGSLDSMSMCRYQTLEERECFDSVYLRGKEDELDPYDVFLGGLGPIIEITNEDAGADEELVVFKDSYAHVLAPFLAQHFKKVTLFDMRYVRRELILDHFDLDGKTILFLYSSSVLNTDPQILN